MSQSSILVTLYLIFKNWYEIINLIQGKIKYRTQIKTSPNNHTNRLMKVVSQLHIYSGFLVCHSQTTSFYS